MTERSAKVVSISNHGDLNLEGNPRPGFPTPSRQLSLAYVVVPRLGSSKNADEPGAWQAREYLRKTLVGKQVTFTVAYTIPTTQREFGQVKIGQQDVSESMLREGLIRYREESSKREDADNTTLEMYQVLEAQARSEYKGLWAQSPGSITATYDSPSDSKSFLSEYKGKPIEAVIEQVRAGDLLRARVLVETTRHQYLNLLIAGIKCPSSAKTNADGSVESGEEFGEDAKTFVEARLNQRAVQITLLGTNQSGNAFVASIHHPAGNIAEALLSNGLARVVDYQSTMVGEGITKLRAAEAAAKQRKLYLWRSFVAKKTQNAGSTEGVISRVFSADTVYVRGKDGSEKRLQMSSIRGPRNNDGKQAPFAAEAKEWLRKKAIGKHVSIVIDFHKPASDGFDERDLASITLGKENLAKLIVEKGYATVIRHRRDDEDRSPVWDELLAAEETAVSEQKGMHSSKGAAAPGRIVEASENITRAKQYLSNLQRAKRVSGVVEFVSSGGRFKILIPRENAKITLVLSGIRVPKTARNASEASEPMGNEAAEYATRKLFQRDVEIEVETTDRIGGFVGSLFINKENFALGLLEEGLASLHEYAAEQSGHVTLYREAENRAKKERKGLYANYDPAAEAATTSPGHGSSSNNNNNNGVPSAPAKREYLDVVITDVNSTAGTFSYQVVGDSIKQLEKLMGELQSTYASSSAAVSQPPRVGDTVAAKFSEDNAWYRGKVKRVDRGTSKAEVLYFDYGNAELVPFKDLTALSAKFNTLPAQAKEAHLSFIEFPSAQSGEYREDAIAYFQSVCQKQLVASVDRRDGSSVFMSLYDPENQDLSESINAEMIREGWATVTSPKKMSWEKAYGTTITLLREKQAEAQKRHRGMFEFGDSTGYDD